MDLLPGYQISETLHASTRTVVYRARREEDGLAVVLKTCQPGVPVMEAQSRARHEYRLLRNRAGAGTIAVCYPKFGETGVTGSPAMLNQPDR